MELDHTRTIEGALKRIAQLERRNVELEAALLFYADIANYDGTRRHVGYRMIDVDDGRRARKVLKQS